METRANYILIGSFTLAVIAAAIGFVLRAPEDAVVTSLDLRPRAIG